MTLLEDISGNVCTENSIRNFPSMPEQSQGTTACPDLPNLIIVMTMSSMTFNMTMSTYPTLGTTYHSEPSHSHLLSNMLATLAKLAFCGSSYANSLTNSNTNPNSKSGHKYPNPLPPPMPSLTLAAPYTATMATKSLPHQLPPY